LIVRINYSLIFCCLLFRYASAQNKFSQFFIPSDTFNSARAWTGGLSVLAGYSAFSIGLYQAWYKKSNLNSFHTFNDAGEWYNLDKLSHSFNAYAQSAIIYNGTRWCGYTEKQAMIWSFSVSMLFQTTVEVMDGFSEDYGFSYPDIAANILGAGLFTIQQYAWHEQKFKLKFSAFPKIYPDQLITGDQGHRITYQQRAKNLYGQAYFTSLLKDYNAQTFWLSFNPGIFSETIRNNWPDYLDLSIGYGADNLYGGYSNEWISDGEHFSADAYPRKSQFYLSMDIDLQKLRIKNPFLRTVVHFLNFIKIPTPALELDSKGSLKWHWLFF
jgi:hypothetical protein